MAAREGKQIDARAVKALSKLSTDNLEKFVHGVIDGVCEKQGARYETFAKTMSLADFSRLVRCVEVLVKAVGRDGGGGDKEKVIESLKEMGLSGELCSVIGRCVRVRREEIRTQLLRDSSKISPSCLTDFDWKLKLVMCSDKMGDIQKPMLSVDFDLMEDGQRRLESIELNETELERLITSLEAANKVVSQLRT